MTDTTRPTDALQALNAAAPQDSAFKSGGELLNELAEIERQRARMERLCEAIKREYGEPK